MALKHKKKQRYEHKFPGCTLELCNWIKESTRRPLTPSWQPEQMQPWPESPLTHLIPEYCDPKWWRALRERLTLTVLTAKRLRSAALNPFRRNYITPQLHRQGFPLAATGGTLHRWWGVCGRFVLFCGAAASSSSLSRFSSSPLRHVGVSPKSRRWLLKWRPPHLATSRRGAECPFGLRAHTHFAEIALEWRQNCRFKMLWGRVISSLPENLQEVMFQKSLNYSTYI